MAHRQFLPRRVTPAVDAGSTPCRATTSKIYPDASVNATMGGFVQYENGAGHASKAYCNVMDMFPPTRLVRPQALPVLATLVPAPPRPRRCSADRKVKPRDSPRLVPAVQPVITALADEFALMDRFFCSHPGPTWPNRMFTISGTSAGSTETGTWYHNKKGSLFPQKTVFDQVRTC